MRIPKPSKVGIFQLFVASLMVALYLSPGEAHHGPSIIIRGGGHGRGGNGVTYLLAAGIVAKLLQQFRHKHHLGHSMSVNSMGRQGYSIGRQGYSMGSHGMGYSYQEYGYEPQEYMFPH